MQMMEFSDWINDKYYQWRGKSKKTVSDYAKELGIPQPRLSEWMKPQSMGGKTPRNKKYISILYKKYGAEVYDVLDLPRPEDPLSLVPTPIRKRLMRAQKEIEKEFRDNGVTGEMPEAEEIAIRIMEKYGFTYKDTVEVPDE